VAGDGTWCRFGSDVAKHKKTQALAERLGLPIYAAGGLLAFLWSWSINHAEGENGSINDFSVRAIERACEWDGERGVLVKALRACGFLDGEPDSEHDPLRIHDWSEYNGAILAHRRKEAEKKRRQREREKVEKLAALPPGDIPGGLSPVTVPGDMSPMTVPLPTVYSQQSTETPTETINRESEEVGAEPSGEASGPPTEPALFSLPLNDGSLHGITQTDVDGYSKLYPTVDVPQEIRKMIGWLNANPAKRKTRRGIKNFVNSWLSREQDKGGKNRPVYGTGKGQASKPYANPEDFY